MDFIKVYLFILMKCQLTTSVYILSICKANEILYQ